MRSMNAGDDCNRARERAEEDCYRAFGAAALACGGSGLNPLACWGSMAYASWECDTAQRRVNEDCDEPYTDAQEECREPRSVDKTICA